MPDPTAIYGEQLASAFPTFDDSVLKRAIADELKNFADAAAGPQNSPTAGMVNRHEQYWKMCPDERCVKPGHVERRGWIIIGPSLKSVKGAFNHEEFKNSKHAVPLPQYGQYEVGYELHQDWRPTLPFGRFTPLVTQPGGLSEFPREQLVSLGWHRNSLVLKARPDLTDQKDFPCPFGCRNRLFASIDAQKQHIEAAHEKQMVSTALGEQISAPMEKITELIAKQANHGFSAEQAMIMATAIVAALKSEGMINTVLEEEVLESKEEELGIPLLSKEELRKPTGRGARI